MFVGFNQLRETKILIGKAQSPKKKMVLRVAHREKMQGKLEMKWTPYNVPKRVIIINKYSELLLMGTANKGGLTMGDHGTVNV